MNIGGFLIYLGLLMIAISVHEYAHAWVAFKLGDNTARYSGRLTLNPLAHLDPIGSILLPLLLFISTGGRFVFGAAKPVPITYWRLRNPKTDTIWIGLSGPLANFILAFLLSILWKPLGRLMPSLSFLIFQLIYINVILGVFNLVPIPPLDGSRIVMGILPRELASRYAMIEPFGFFIVLLLAGLGLFNTVIWPIVNIILSWLSVFQPHI